MVCRMKLNQCIERYNEYSAHHANKYKVQRLADGGSEQWQAPQTHRNTNSAQRNQAGFNAIARQLAGKQ